MAALTRAALLTLAALASVSIAPMSAQTPAAATVPPIIDRELFFGNPEISGAQISPDGRYIAFLKPYKDTRNIWVKGWQRAVAAARLVTNDTKRPVSAVFLEPRRQVHPVRPGPPRRRELQRLRRRSGSAAPPPAQEVPTARNLTAAKGVRAFIYSVPKTIPNVIYVGINDRDRPWHDLYKVDIATGERTLMRQNTESISGWVFDNAGTLRLASRTTRQGRHRNSARRGRRGFTQVYTCTVFETCGPVRFHKDGSTRVHGRRTRATPI